MIDGDEAPEGVTAIFIRQPGLRSLGNPVLREQALSYLWGEAARIVAGTRPAL